MHPIVILAFVAVAAGLLQVEGFIDRAHLQEVAAAESIAGDVDGDGVVDSIDAFLLLQFHAGIIGIGQPYSEKADVNNDQRVNSIDAALILRFHAGLIESL